jgi:hypothetical protein
MTKLSYPKKQLLVMRNLAEQLVALINGLNPAEISMILIEEVNMHKSRMTGKTLDGAHFIVMDHFEKAGFIDRVRFIDSDGAVGWRSRLGLVLSDVDKEVNKKHKAINKRKKKGTSDLVIVNKKHLAARYVNSRLGTSFDVDADPTANDVVDAIGLGLSELLTMR